jgi:hypothetical protein
LTSGGSPGKVAVAGIGKIGHDCLQNSHTRWIVGMAQTTGQCLPLPLPRRWIADLLHAARRVPTVTVERVVNVSAVVAARKSLANPPAWVLLFTKAYATVAARRPELRRAYLPFPCPHLFQADESVATVAVEREFQGEPAVFFGHIRHPDQQSLRQLMNHLQRWRTHPIEDIRSFSRLIRYSRMPFPLRRMTWWYAANVSRRWRLRVFGTFGVSVTAGDGATALNLITPLSTSVNYGVLSPEHTLPVRVHFDHRVMDGAPVARALVEVEEIMNTTIVTELRQMPELPATIRLAPDWESAAA